MPSTLSHNGHPIEEKTFFNALRRMLSGNTTPLAIPSAWEASFDPSFSQTYITLFEEGLKPLRWGTRRESLLRSVLRIVQRLKEHERFAAFHPENADRCRIMLEFVYETRPCNIRNLTTMKFTKDRFEPGVSGLKAVYGNDVRFFMPTDAVTHSVMSVNQLLHFLSKRFGISKETKSISERVHRMRRLPITYFHIRSHVWISYKEEVLPMHRGLPPTPKLSQKQLYNDTQKALEWVVRNQKEDGSFTYYYDPVTDSYVDFAHPRMRSPLYNNILRHSGGTITLLQGYAQFKEKRYLQAAKRSIDFFVSTLREHTFQGEYACYPYFNKKVKLGGAGIGLVALMQYRSLSQDRQYDKYIEGLVRHLLSRIDETGEMIGYYIHPKYNGGKPIISPDPETEKALFSFYYPGEALLGLALFYRDYDTDDTELKKAVFTQSRKAMDFLIDVRPKKYSHLFEPLPSDAWLMQAVEQWHTVAGFTQQKDIDFVFDDAQRMFDHMYQDYNTFDETKDYIGGFYYSYGDHVYHDTSRNEGVVAAYYLAKQLGDQKRATYIMTHMLRSAQGLMLTYHSERSAYAHLFPKKSIGTFRFKLTRQWIRIDSIQHAVCFLLRLCKTGFTASDISLSERTKGYIDGYEILHHIDKSGFSDVYLVQKHGSGQKQVMKRLINPKLNIDFIRSEIHIMEQLDCTDSIPRFYGYHRYSDGSYFLFDYIEGERLNRYIKRFGTLSEEEALSFLETMSRLLGVCEKKNILHLDIKTGNIMYNGNTFTLIDWGLAVQKRQTPTYHLKGNPIYFPPETYYGYRNSAADIYAVGCTLYEILTGERIFGLRKADSLIKKMYCHQYCYPDLTKISSPKLRTILMQMLDKNPDTRLQRDALDRLLQKHEKAFNMPNPLPPCTVLENDALMLGKMVDDKLPYALLLKVRNMLVEHHDYSLDEILTPLTSAARYLPEADTLLGILYFEHRKYKEAFKHLLVAKNVPDAKAAYYLFFIYRHGLQTERDLQKAYYWLEKARQRGYKIPKGASHG